MNYFIKKNLYSSYKHSFNFEIHDNKYKLSLNIHCMIESYLRYMEFERQFHLVGRHMQLILGNQTSISR